jgi:hypothetical protein
MMITSRVFDRNSLYVRTSSWVESQGLFCKLSFRVMTLGPQQELAEEAQARRSFILRLLARKLGTIEDAILDQINALSIDQLELLGEALLDFGAIDDLMNWLDNQE